MKTHGELTAWIAHQISDEWGKRGYDVFYDHGSKGNMENVGKIVSWFGEKYNHESELSQLDIAIVKKNSEKVFALIEIEETNDRPKTFLGDIFGVLLGEQIRFRGKQILTVDEQTTLIVIGQSEVRHEIRNKHLCENTMKIKSSLSTANSKIGKIVIDTFSQEAELNVLLASVLDQAFKEDSQALTQVGVK